MKKQDVIKYFLAAGITTIMGACGSGGNTNTGNEVNNETVCDSGYNKVYAIVCLHPSASISSSSNRISIKTFCQDNKDLNNTLSKDIGSFVDNKYKVYYSSEDKPKYGHDKYAYYSGTQYNGLSEIYMYASSSKSEFKTKVKNDIDNHSCKGWAANSSGSLNSSGNFWTYFCPKEELIPFL